MRSTTTFFLQAMVCALAAAGTVTARPAVAGDDTATGTGRPAYGLIVKFRDTAPPPPAAGSREQAAGALPSEAAQALGAARARQAVREARLAVDGAEAPVRTRPVGRAAQWIGFGRLLGAAEAADFAARLRARSDVEWVVPNERERRLQTFTPPNDPFFADQWWLQPVAGSNANVLADRRRGVQGLQAAWRVQTGQPAAVVAVLDTGITPHPELIGHVVGGHDFVSEVDYANDGDGRDADPSDPGDWVDAADQAANPSAFRDCPIEDSSWHGTIIAGLLAGATDNAAGVAATSWNGRVVPVRVAGKCGATVADIIDGMRWAAGLPVAGAPANPNPARIVTLSFGGDGPCNAAYQATVDELRGAGAIVVAAAGNENAAPTRPASCRDVIGVTALNRDGFKASYANFGAGLALAAVGGDSTTLGAWGPRLGDPGLLTIDNRGATRPGTLGYAYVSGTSFSAPVVSGIAALMLSVNPALGTAQLADGLVRSARPHVTAPKIPVCSDAVPGRCVCTTDTCGAGIADAVEAVRYAADPAGYVAPARSPAVIDNADVDAAVALGPDRPANPPSDSGGGGGGGGAVGAAALAALAAAVIALRRAARS